MHLDMGSTWANSGELLNVISLCPSIIAIDHWIMDSTVYSPSGRNCILCLVCKSSKLSSNPTNLSCSSVITGSSGNGIK